MNTQPGDAARACGSCACRASCRRRRGPANGPATLQRVAEHAPRAGRRGGQQEHRQHQQRRRQAEHDAAARRHAPGQTRRAPSRPAAPGTASGRTPARRWLPVLIDRDVRASSGSGAHARAPPPAGTRRTPPAPIALRACGRTISAAPASSERQRADVERALLGEGADGGVRRPAPVVVEREAEQVLARQRDAREASGGRRRRWSWRSSSRNGQQRDRRERRPAGQRAARTHVGRPDAGSAPRAGAARPAGRRRRRPCGEQVEVRLRVAAEELQRHHRRQAGRRQRPAGARSSRSVSSTATAPAPRRWSAARTPRRAK